MNLAARNRSARFAASITMLCLGALASTTLVAPPEATARVKVIAKVRPGAPAAVRVTARTSKAAKRVVFLVDGRRRGLKRSVDWRHGRKGLIRLRGLGPGRHRLTAVAIHRRGRVSRGVEVIRLRQRPHRTRRRIALRRAKQVEEPKPARTVRTLPGGVLFDGGFDDGFESWHVQALSHRVGIFDVGALHGSAARFEVHENDVEPETGNERAEVSGPTFHEGQDLYVRNSIRVSSATNSETDWQLIQQLRENDWGGSPGMAVFLEDDRELEIGAGDGSPMYWEDTELEPDRWYDLVYRVMLSQDPDVGFVEAWLDGVQQEMLNGEARIYGPTLQRPSNYLKTGIYRSESSTGVTVVDHDNVIVGTSYEAVMAAG